MIRRFFLTFWLPMALFFTLALTHWPARAAEAIDITQAHLEMTEEGYKLAANFSFELNRGLEDAILRGIPLYFTTVVEITRPRWYWFDERAITASQTVRISYNLLTRQFRTVILGSLQQNFSTLEDALSVIRRPGRWLVADKSALRPGETYNVAVHMELDIAQLPKPFQVHAMNSSDWRMSSEWKYFTFKVDNK